jgi:hypothetical protein
MVVAEGFTIGRDMGKLSAAAVFAEYCRQFPAKMFAVLQKVPGGDGLSNRSIIKKQVYGSPRGKITPIRLFGI